MLFTQLTQIFLSGNLARHKEVHIHQHYHTHKSNVKYLPQFPLFLCKKKYICPNCCRGMNLTRLPPQEQINDAEWRVVHFKYELPVSIKVHILRAPEKHSFLTHIEMKDFFFLPILMIDGRRPDKLIWKTRIRQWWGEVAGSFQHLEGFHCYIL